MRELVLDAPWIQVAPAMALMVMAAALLYRIDRGNRHVPGGLRALLGVLRATVLATLVLLLFRPVLRNEERSTTQPALIVLQDASRSVGQDEPGWGRPLALGSTPCPPRKANLAPSSPHTDSARSSSNGPTMAAFSTLRSRTSPRPLKRWKANGPVGPSAPWSSPRTGDSTAAGIRNPPGSASALPCILFASVTPPCNRTCASTASCTTTSRDWENRFPIEVEIGSQGLSGTARVTLTGPGTRLRGNRRTHPRWSAGQGHLPRGGLGSRTAAVHGARSQRRRGKPTSRTTAVP